VYDQDQESLANIDLSGTVGNY